MSLNYFPNLNSVFSVQIPCLSSYIPKTENLAQAENSLYSNLKLFNHLMKMNVGIKQTIWAFSA